MSLVQRRAAVRPPGAMAEGPGRRLSARLQDSPAIAGTAGSETRFPSGASQKTGAGGSFISANAGTAGTAPGLIGAGETSAGMTSAGSCISNHTVCVPTAPQLTVSSRPCSQTSSMPSSGAETPACAATLGRRRVGRGTDRRACVRFRTLLLSGTAAACFRLRRLARRPCIQVCLRPDRTGCAPPCPAAEPISTRPPP